MIVYPQIDPVALSLGPLKIHWYGLTYLAGFLLAWWFARRRALAGKGPLTPAAVEDMIFYGAIGVIAGGRIGYLLFYGWSSIAEDWRYIYRVWEGGMSFHGGLLGVAFAMVLFARKYKKTFFEITDFVVPIVPLGLFTGRIGNFINGELWGRETDVPWGFLVNGVVRHPSMLYEALLEGVVLFILMWTYTAKPRPRMAASGLFLIGYGVFRMLVEIVRIPDSQYGYLAFDWLTMGQVLSAPMVIIGLGLMTVAYTKASERGSK